MDGMVYAALAYSTIPKGRITAIDVAAAESAPGVVLVMTHRNAPRLTDPAMIFAAGADPAAGDDLPIMQDDRIHWNGQPIAVVLAETQDQADHATSLIRAGYESEPAVTAFDEATARGTQVATFLGTPLSEESGDAEAALAAAPHAVDSVYRTPRHNLADLGDPGRWESYESLLDGAGRDEVSAEAVTPPPVEMGSWSMHSFGALFCEVRVNAVTGEILPSRFLGSFDCGRILNARTAASQFRGGIIMGLGLALMEETLFDERSGHIMNPSLAEYHVPVHMDVPEIDVIWTDIPDPHASMGVHGIGEIGITGVGAAVANADCNATGTRVRDLPITLDKLLGSSGG